MSFIYLRKKTLIQNCFFFFFVFAVSNHWKGIGNKKNPIWSRSPEDSLTLNPTTGNTWKDTSTKQCQPLCFLWSISMMWGEERSAQLVKYMLYYHHQLNLRCVGKGNSLGANTKSLKTNMFCVLNMTWNLQQFLWRISYMNDFSCLPGYHLFLYCIIPIILYYIDDRKCKYYLLRLYFAYLYMWYIQSRKISVRYLKLSLMVLFVSYFFRALHVDICYH